MAEGFQVGDVVSLKSGSPLMTLSWIGDNGEGCCVWFNKSENRIEFTNINCAALEKETLAKKTSSSKGK